ncbi:MAG: hypothetical protein KatS3mg081_0004 [Gemmatimonadales bacterium]|nr:MAG: hypothetical protein KatS3mg081_0004 [Gemmatimonadales bacterium]
MVHALGAEGVWFRGPWELAGGTYGDLRVQPVLGERCGEFERLGKGELVPRVRRAAGFSLEQRPCAPGHTARGGWVFVSCGLDLGSRRAGNRALPVGSALGESRHRWFLAALSVFADAQACRFLRRAPLAGSLAAGGVGAQQCLAFFSERRAVVGRGGEQHPGYGGGCAPSGVRSRWSWRRRLPTAANRAFEMPDPALLPLPLAGRAGLSFQSLAYPAGLDRSAGSFRPRAVRRGFSRPIHAGGAFGSGLAGCFHGEPVVGSGDSECDSVERQCARFSAPLFEDGRSSEHALGRGGRKAAGRGSGGVSLFRPGSEQRSENDQRSGARVAAALGGGFVLGVRPFGLCAGVWVGEMCRGRSSMR